MAKPVVNKNVKNEKKSGGIVAYFKGVKQEMSKVVWPTKKELGAYAAVVIVTCAFFAVFFWAIDTGFLALLQKVLGITISQ